MARIFAVTLDPGDGPEDIFLIEADSAAPVADVKARVLKYLHDHDSDGATLDQLTVATLGSPENIFAIGDVASQVILDPRSNV